MATRRDNLIESFDALALAGKPPSPTKDQSRQAPRDEGFIGGFHPRHNSIDSTKALPQIPTPYIPSPGGRGDGQFPGALPSTPNRMSMPIPQYAPYQSLTMQYAVNSPLPQPPAMQPNTPPRPNVASRPPPIPSGSGSPYTPTQSDTSDLPRPYPHPHPHSPPPPSKLYPPTPPYQRPPHTRPHSDSALPPPSPQLASSTSSPPPRPSTTKPSPGLAIPPNRRPRAASTPPSPISASTSTSTSGGGGGNGTVQCSGVTKAGKRCTRQIKLRDLDVGLGEGGEGEGERFCHQHAKELMGPSGFYSRKGGSEWIKFEDWIPEYLSMETQVALRVEMEKARSLSDVPGYIYTFEILDPTTPTQLHLKVGRATNLVKRIDQWTKQCNSKEQVLRGYYPDPQDFDAGEQQQGSMMKGRVKAGEKVAWCHRLERLIHLELGDLVESGVYREVGWPTKVGGGKDGKDGTKGKGKDGDGKGGKDGKDGATVAGLATPPRKRTPPAAKSQTKRCPDCGSLHKEIFTFTRIERGRYKGKEWESIVKPIVEKWGAFVEAYL